MHINKKLGTRFSFLFFNSILLWTLYSLFAHYSENSMMIVSLGWIGYITRAPKQDLEVRGAVQQQWLSEGSLTQAECRVLWCYAGKTFIALFALQNVAEAQCIANQVQLFYATDRKETFGLVETFNFRPNEFKYMSVIAELEQSGLGAELKCAQNQSKT